MRILHWLVYFPNVPSSQGLALLKLEAGNSVHVSHVVVEIQVLEQSPVTLQVSVVVAGSWKEKQSQEP